MVKFDEHMVALHPDMYVVVDGSMYSASEVKRLGDKNSWMKLSRVGNALRIESRHYPVWALLEADGTIKIGASEVLAGHVDGLCGFLDGLAANDQQMPEGNMAKSTKDFGDSWKVVDSAECKLKVGRLYKIRELSLLYTLSYNQMFSKTLRSARKRHRRLLGRRALWYATPLSVLATKP